MREIKVPSITANEDVVILREVLTQHKDKLIKKDEVICTLESSKTSFEFLSPEEGYINFLFNEGDELRIGEVFLLISEKQLNDRDIDLITKKNIPNTEPKISKKAKLLMEENNIETSEIKKNGIISSNDVLSYLTSKNFTKKINNSNPDQYSDLERVMKRDLKNSIKMKDIENLKDQLGFAQKKYQEKWNRFIPPYDVLFDRWKNGENFGFGENSNISSMSYVIGNVKIGKNCYIGPFTILDGSGGLEIGDNTSIAAGVHIYSHDTISKSLSGGKFSTSHTKVVVGDNCFIGPSAVVTRGVSIGNNCFLGANSVLTFNLKDNQAAAGNPCEMIGNVEVQKDRVIIKK